MEQIVVTDYTRFKDPSHVCLAGLKLDGSGCIRPMKSRTLSKFNPYLEYAESQILGIKAGTVIEGNFSKILGLESPHSEDHHYDTSLKVISSFDENILHSALKSSSFDSLSDGFGVHVEGKFIPADGEIPNHSIVTVSIQPQSIQLVVSYDKLRVHFVDRSGVRFEWLAITDIGLKGHIESAKDPAKIAKHVSDNFKKQEEVYLRVGVGRPYLTDDGRGGYWFQVNGIYTFPYFFHDFRNY